ncbi:hypothetical protein, partial [Bifidobacterium jacchi]|uniref:hypothetical protein n=1 Tax=Bifidobacterium jacchi TaxID=2490545 RepID=UPI0019D61AD7
LHVLSTPPAFILSQNRTLHKKHEGQSENRLSKRKRQDSSIRQEPSHKNLIPIQPTKDPTTKAGLGTNWQSLTIKK